VALNTINQPNQPYTVCWYKIVTGQACGVNQYHYEPLQLQVVMRFVHATDETRHTLCNKWR